MRRSFNYTLVFTIFVALCLAVNFGFDAYDTWQTQENQGLLFDQNMIMEKQFITLDQEFSKKLSNAIKGITPPSSMQKTFMFMIPAVRIEAQRSTGSGVLIHVEYKDGKFINYILTANHLFYKTDVETPKLQIASPIDNEIHTFDITILENLEDIDIALLSFETPLPLFIPCRPLATVGPNVDLFDEVYTVGCPVGLPPYPTKGEISSFAAIFGDKSFWTCNAIIWTGNSGGGVYLSKTGGLIGIMSRVPLDNFGGRIHPVNHVSIFIPITEIRPALIEKYPFLFN